MTRLHLILIFFLPTLSFGQTRQNETPKFEFTQIDSIVNSNLKTLDKDSFFVAHQVWYVGSFVFNEAKHLDYTNPFEILIYYKQNDKYFVKKIDNLGSSKIIKSRTKEIIKFLDDNFIKMKSEELSRKQDTIIVNDSTIRVTSSFTDHQREDRIWINYKGQTLSYYFPAEFADNKWNLTKKQYLFLKLLQRQKYTLTQKLKTK